MLENNLTNVMSKQGSGFLLQVISLSHVSIFTSVLSLGVSGWLKLSARYYYQVACGDIKQIASPFLYCSSLYFIPLFLYFSSLPLSRTLAFLSMPGYI